MEFEKRKAATLASMGSTEPDKSPKGTIDRHIVPLLNAINRHPSYFTTSSCSGRISILSQPSPAATNAHKKARGGTWLFITHDLADPTRSLPSYSPQLVAHLSTMIWSSDSSLGNYECEQAGDGGGSVFDTAGGPLGGGGRVLVSPEYVRYLVGIANEKMETNRRRTEGFLQALQSSGFVESFNGGAGLDGAMGGDEHGCSDCKDGDANSERIIAEKESGVYLSCEMNPSRRPCDAEHNCECTILGYSPSLVIVIVIVLVHMESFKVHSAQRKCCVQFKAKEAEQTY
ncbi:tRNA wybutosine-synthesizing protein 2/3/4 [Vitis vinifera]|uniref:tRNA(Phe) 7-[(3-amino-3-carboxypropyl)-4-demethylwyosine(37)-N(4)]-methyltransferase n=1 Tax=Vitis vinifera TaxID=29760 RepID=A0A438JG17_VITVI|nr:tRNA wybutosine-synthesizing protein 2/3/4 [Vitis vinifera]